MNVAMFVCLALTATSLSAGYGLAAGAEMSVRRLTNIDNAYPRPSPDGRRVVFQSNRTGRFEIYTMDPHGGDVRQLTNAPGNNVTPDWSPDSSRIIFAANPPDGNTDVSNLFMIHADGSGLVQLTHGFVDTAHPHWSAATGRIVFNSGKDAPTGDLSNVFSMLPDGTDVKQHTHCATVCSFASFSPDGKRIVYRKSLPSAGLDWALKPSDRDSEVFVADVDGAHERNLSHDIAFDGWPAWSPDGRRITFTSNRRGPANVGQVFIVDADGSNLRQLTDGPWSHVQPAWSSDGKQIFANEMMETETSEFGNVVAIEVQVRNGDEGK